MKYKLNRQQASICFKCEYRDKNLSEIVKCPKISCINERIQKSNGGHSASQADRVAVPTSYLYK